MARGSAPKRQPRKGGQRHSKGAPNNIRSLGVPADGRVVLYRNPTQLHRFIRSTPPTFLAKAAADGGWNLNFSLSLLTSITDFTGLYDDYRIDKMELEMIWNPGAVAAQTPVFDVVQDWDGSGAAPATSSELVQYAALQKVCFDTTHRTVTLVVHKPFILTVTSVSASAMRRGAWVDVANTTEPFFGIRLWGNDYNTTVASGSVSYVWRAFISFRGQR